MTRHLPTACIFAIAIGYSTLAMGQGFSGGSGRSAFGGGGFGTSSFGTSGMTSSRFGSAGFGASRFGAGGTGMAGFGTSRFGGSGLGMTGFGSNGFGTSGLGAFGLQSSGVGGYGGGQNFVGRDGADIAATFSQFSRSGTQFFNQMNRNMRRGNRNNQPSTSLENVEQPMRVSIQVAFDAPRPVPEMVATNLRARLGNILAAHNIAQPDVTMEGDAAVLRGVAASDSQRLMLEKLIALEPGVRQVRNEMTVASPPAATAPATRPPGN